MLFIKQILLLLVIPPVIACVCFFFCAKKKSLTGSYLGWLLCSVFSCIDFFLL